jgi:hypothetical protein
MFTSRLFGIKRMAKGETLEWVTELPLDALESASRWSRICMNFPVECTEIGWVEGSSVKVVDKFSYRKFKSDWKTKALKVTVLPPVYFLAKNVGAPVSLPEKLIDLNCPTNYGPLKAVSGSTTEISTQVLENLEFLFS